MKNRGILNIDWNDITKYTEEDITFFLFLEGKSIESICKIRKLDKEIVQKHVLDGKIKYGILAKSRNIKELFESICKSGKQDKIEALKGLEEENKIKLIQFIRENYGSMVTKEKENAIWILGEIAHKEVIDILTKASVHKHVNVRRMAVSAVGKIKDKGMEALLIRCLEDENPQVVMYSIKALGKIKSKSSKSKVKQIVHKWDKDYIKRVAEQYFNEIEEVD
ncbi:HEAT repeat domain-containing protein [Clostridium sp. DJ247]|nr:HEAT repeat domain-containing protein [Clostridium sp. DJ247]MBC2581159.1 HEAT repeat domain-containing protein [Clostridium sp. DJ247]